MGGWIEDYTDFLVEQTGTNRDWAESIATSICSAAIGGDKFLYTKQGMIKMNLFFLYIGPSGLAKKSLPMASFGSKLLEKYDELRADDIKTELPRRFSLESLITYFSETSTEGLLWKDEFTSMFKEANKEYMSGLIEFVSELVDGRLGARYTNKNKMQLPQDVYVNVLAATTPYIYQILSQDFFTQGTGNRVLYMIYDGVYKPQEILATEDYLGSINKEIHDTDQERFAKDLTLLGKSQLNYLQPIDDAGQMWLRYRNDLDDRLRKTYKDNQFDIKTVYLGKAAVNTLKLAGLHRYSRLCRDKDLQDILNDMDSELILVEDMEWAIKKTDDHLNHFTKLVEQWHTRPDRYSKDIESQTLLDLVTKHKDGLPYHQVKRTCKWNDRTVREVFKSLFEQKLIKFYLKKSTGRHAMVLADQENSALDDDDDYSPIESWNGIRTLCGW